MLGQSLLQVGIALKFLQQRDDPAGRLRAFRPKRIEIGFRIIMKEKGSQYIYLDIVLSTIFRAARLHGSMLARVPRHAG
jgi:hypothetical protein